jgi:hypothetical protein
MTITRQATVFFDGVQIYEAGLAEISIDVEGKWKCMDDYLVRKVYSSLHLYGREYMKNQYTYIYGYYITKDGGQIHLWSSRPTDEFREKHYQ